MKVISVSRRSKILQELLQQATQSNLILPAEKGDQFVLARTISRDLSVLDQFVNQPAEALAFTIGESDDFAEEVAQTRQNQALMRFLEKRAAQVKPDKGASIEEVRRRLAG